MTTPDDARRALAAGVPTALAALLDVAANGRTARDRERARRVLVSFLRRPLADEKTPAGTRLPAGVLGRAEGR